MPHTLTSDIAYKSLDVLRERALQPRNGSQDDAQELLDNCEVPFLLINRQWQSIQEVLDRGIEKQRFMVRLNDCLEMIEQTAATMTTVRERVQAATLPPQNKTAGLALLDRLEQEAAKKRDELMALKRWLETPRPEIDPSKLPHPRPAREVEGYADLDDLKGQWFSDKDS